MSLKQAVSIVLISLLVILSGGSLVPSYADTIPLPKEQTTFTATDLSMTDAIQIAQGAACEQRNTTLAERAGETVKAGVVLLENGQKAWVITLFR